MTTTTEQEQKGGKLPLILKKAIEEYSHRIGQNPSGELAVDRDSGFATTTGYAWDILLSAGWRTNDGGHRTIIESNATTAAYLIRHAEPCDCEDCQKEQKT